MPFVATRTGIDKLMPNAKPEWASALASLSQRLVPFYAMDRLEWVHFVGQIAHETNGLSLGGMKENMRFTTPARIREVYAYRLRLCLQKLDRGEVSEPAWARGMTVDQLCRRLVGSPEELARIVYGGREGTPWYEGHRYIGRGPTQITHLDNYRAIGQEIARQPGGSSVDLVANPELLEQPEWGVRSAFADWHLKDLRKFAWVDDVDRVSAALNTGSPNKISITNGLQSRRRWVAKAKGVWPATSDRELVDAKILREGSKGDDVKRLQKRLAELGYPVGAQDGVYGPLVRRAVVAFQSEHGLVVDGEVGPRTWDALNSSAPIVRDVSEKELADRGSEIVQAGQSVKSWGRVMAFLGVGTGVGTLSDAVGLASNVRTSAEQISDILGWVLSPTGLAVVGCGVVAFVMWRISAWAERIIQARVRDAQTGAHLGR